MSSPCKTVATFKHIGQMPGGSCSRVWLYAIPPPPPLPFLPLTKTVLHLWLLAGASALPPPVQRGKNGTPASMNGHRIRWTAEAWGGSGAKVRGGGLQWSRGKEVEMAEMGLQGRAGPLYAHPKRHTLACSYKLDGCPPWQVARPTSHSSIQWTDRWTKRAAFIGLLGYSHSNMLKSSLAWKPYNKLKQFSSFAIMQCYLLHTKSRPKVSSSHNFCLPFSYWNSWDLFFQIF